MTPRSKCVSSPCLIGIAYADINQKSAPLGINTCMVTPCSSTCQTRKAGTKRVGNLGVPNMLSLCLLKISNLCYSFFKKSCFGVHATFCTIVSDGGHWHDICTDWQRIVRTGNVLQLIRKCSKCFCERDSSIFEHARSRTAHQSSIFALSKVKSAFLGF